MKVFLVQFFCVFLPPLLNIFCFCRSIPFLSFTEPIFAWNVSLVSLIFLKRYLVFPTLLFSSVFLHWSLRNAFLSLLVILWNSACRWVYLSFSPLPLASRLFSATVKPPPTTILPFCICFSWGWCWSLPPVQCHEPPFIVFQDSISSNPLNLLLRSTV